MAKRKAMADELFNLIVQDIDAHVAEMGLNEQQKLELVRKIRKALEDINAAFDAAQPEMSGLETEEGEIDDMFRFNSRAPKGM